MKRLIVAAMVVVFTSCASGPRAGNMPAGVEASDWVSQLRGRLEEDRSRQYDWVSPEHFERAAEALDRAQARLDRGESSADTIEDASEAAGELQVVEENAGRYSGQLFTVLKARQDALNAQAHALYPDQFDGVDQRLRGFGIKVEEDDFDVEASELNQLAQTYTSLQAQASEQSSLDEVRNLIGEAESMGATTLTPQSLAEAQSQLQIASQAIEQNSHSPDVYASQVSIALQAAQKLQRVHRLAKRFNLSEDEAIQLYAQTSGTDDEESYQGGD